MLLNLYNDINLLEKYVNKIIIYCAYVSLDSYIRNPTAKNYFKSVYIFNSTNRDDT